MPVYVRKNLMSITPDSLSNLSSDDEDFLTDPDQMLDRLPQPFRLINKLLVHIFDRAWEQVSIREDVRIEESSRVKPPQYECAIQLQDLEQTTCLKQSPDGRYIFVGLPNGLAVLDATHHIVLARWQQEEADISTLEISLIGVQMYLVTAIDDLGLLRMFFFAFNGLHFFRVLNDQDGMKTMATGVILSNEADYIAVSMQGSDEVWLDVFKVPRDSWLQELDTAHNNAIKQQGAQAKAKDTTVDHPIEVSDPSEHVSGVPLERSTSRNQTPLSRAQSVDFTAELHQKTSDVKSMNISNLSKPAHILRVRPPPPFTALPNCTPHVALSKLDDGAILGSGTKHLISEAHSDLRTTVFQHLHEKDLRCLPKDDDETVQRPQSLCVFLNAGRMLPIGLESPANTGRPNCIAVAWSGSTNLYHYSLLKQTKDIEHKPELVWPHSSPITVLSTTPCTSLLGIGLQDGTLLVWDKAYGVPIKVQKISSHGYVTYINFLNPSVLGEDPPSLPPYATKHACVALVGCSDGSLTSLTCGSKRTTESVSIVDRSAYDIEKFSFIQTFPSFPQVIVTVRKTGAVMLYDAVKGNAICEVVLPVTHQLSTPWSPSITLGAEGQMLFMKANLLNPDKEYMPHSGDSSVFAFQLRSFPSLDCFWQNIQEPLPFTVHVTVEKRFDAYLADRLAAQNKRQIRMQERWSKLKNDVNAIQKLRDAKVDENRVR
ncbi:WD repeat-containing protein 93-like isoform X2 [Anneissia japonica]|uniref:WD repeat-containing protein 93-like isoform X2 n=1 Tax=Anneissia japonica TaxID=1529436 RepID=UPI0014259D26|nr:WD repeat-containing protein 93-like isoform X2 [Anneissia japonica]